MKNTVITPSLNDSISIHNYRYWLKQSNSTASLSTNAVYRVTRDTDYWGHLVDKIFARLWCWRRFLFRKETFEHNGGATDTAGVRRVLETSCRGDWWLVDGWRSLLSAGVNGGWLGLAPGWWWRLTYGIHYQYKKLINSVIKSCWYLAVATPSTTHFTPGCSNSRLHISFNASAQHSLALFNVV